MSTPYTGAAAISRFIYAHRPKRLHPQWRQYLFFLFLFCGPYFSYQVGRTDSRPKPQPAALQSILTAPATVPPAPAAVPLLPHDAQASPPTPLLTLAVVSNGYVRGQCTYYVASRRPIPPHWGNARNWLANARRVGWKTGSQPQIGAIAWSPIGYYGHVAYVEAVSADGAQVTVSEMNFDAWNRVTHRTTAASSFLYIY